MKLTISTILTLTSAAFAGDLASLPSPMLALDDPQPVSLWSSGRPDGHAPIGVMAEHNHGKGEWMASDRYMHMSMEQNFGGNSRLSDADIISPSGEGYIVTPQWMTMDMHMFGVMHAPTDKLTLMLGIPYVVKEMGHLRRDGVEFDTKSEGWGDVKLTGIFELYHGPQHALLASLGLSAPTGAVEEEDFIPGPGVTRLPYPMQIGSGTWDLHPGLTYLGQTDSWSWGSQLSGTVRLGENDEGYTLGNVGQLTAWGAYRWSDYLSSSLRVTGRAWGDIDGADEDLVVGPVVVPTADPSLRAGKQIDLSVGVNLYFPSGVLKGQRLAAEVGIPIYRDLDGPQLSSEWTLTLGWQWAF